jgi:hypothetical protein
MAEVKALAVRREAILLSRLAPGYAGSVEICRRCAFASGCEKFNDGRLRMALPGHLLTSADDR